MTDETSLDFEARTKRRTLVEPPELSLGRRAVLAEWMYGAPQRAGIEFWTVEHAGHWTTARGTLVGEPRGINHAPKLLSLSNARP